MHGADIYGRKHPASAGIYLDIETIVQPPVKSLGRSGEGVKHFFFLFAMALEFKRQHLHDFLLIRRAGGGALAFTQLGVEGLNQSFELIDR